MTLPVAPKHALSTLASYPPAPPLPPHPVAACAAAAAAAAAGLAPAHPHLCLRAGPARFPVALAAADARHRAGPVGGLPAAGPRGELPDSFSTPRLPALLAASSLAALPEQALLLRAAGVCGPSSSAQCPPHTWLAHTTCLRCRPPACRWAASSRLSSPPPWRSSREGAGRFDLHRRTAEAPERRLRCGASPEPTPPAART